MSRPEARDDANTNGLPTTYPTKPPNPTRQWVPWKERIRYGNHSLTFCAYNDHSPRHFSWQWMAIVTATSVTSSLIHIWPYHNDSPGLKIVSVIVFLVALIVFVFNWLCITLKAVLYPKVRYDPSYH